MLQLARLAKRYPHLKTLDLSCAPTATTHTNGRLHPTDKLLLNTYHIAILPYGYHITTCIHNDCRSM